MFLTLLQNRTSLSIRPIEDDEMSAPSVKFPVRTVLRLEIGKTKSSVLGRSLYDHVDPMTCFSIVVQLWTDAETYFDFEASSVIEREALISTLMVVLDQMHNNNNNNPVCPGGPPSVIGPAWMYPGKSQDHSPGENLNVNTTIDPKLPSGICLSPGKRTKIYSGTFFEGDLGDEEEQMGTEIRLVYSKQHEEMVDHPPTTILPFPFPKTNSNSNNNSINSKTKPLRQRQLQPAVEDPDDMHHALSSPPRTPFMRQSSRDFLGATTTKPSPKGSANGSSPQAQNSPLEVVFVDRMTTKDNKSKSSDQHGNSSTVDDGGIVILDSSNCHPHQAATNEIEIGLQSSPANADADLQTDDSFEITHQGLPVSMIKISPTRDNYDPGSGCCNLAAVANMDQMNNGCNSGSSSNPQMPWCSDDVCTLALKDIAETCTGIFNHHPESFPKDPNNADTTKTADGGIAADDERACVEEYIAGVLGGPTCAVGVFFPDGDVWNIDSSKQTGAAQNAKNKTNRIKNRASLLNAQALRLRTLRNEMTFAAALKRSKEKMQYVQTTKSFDDADSELLRQAQERSMKRLHTSALMGHVMGSMVLSKPEVVEDYVYYDSDPEDIRPRTKGVRRALADRRNAVGKDEEEKHQSRSVLSGVGFERIAVGKKLRKLDEGLIIQIVQVCVQFLFHQSFFALSVILANLTFLCNVGDAQRDTDTNVAPHPVQGVSKSISCLCEFMDRVWCLFSRRVIPVASFELECCL